MLRALSIGARLCARAPLLHTRRSGRLSLRCDDHPTSAAGLHRIGRRTRLRPEQHNDGLREDVEQERRAVHGLSAARMRFYGPFGTKASRTRPCRQVSAATANGDIRRRAFMSVLDLEGARADGTQKCLQEMFAIGSRNQRTARTKATAISEQ